MCTRPSCRGGASQGSLGPVPPVVGWRVGLGTAPSAAPDWDAFCHCLGWI